MNKKFGKCKILLSGDFGKDRSYDKIKKWVEYMGATYAAKFDWDITHLVCSMEDYKKQATKVKQVSVLKDCKIVSWDWLEDSMHSKSPKRVGKYLMKTIVKSRTKAKRTRKEERDAEIKEGLQKFDRGIKAFMSTMYTDGYHIYRDPVDGFNYSITLARPDLARNTNERYQMKVAYPNLTPFYPYISPSLHNIRVPISRPRTQMLQLYESHVSPTMYAVFVTYFNPNYGTCTEILAPLGSSFELAMGVWEDFFRVKTRREWRDRDEIQAELEGPMAKFAYTYVKPVAEQEKVIKREPVIKKEPGIKEEPSLEDDELTITEVRARAASVGAWLAKPLRAGGGR